MSEEYASLLVVIVRGRHGGRHTVKPFYFDYIIVAAVALLTFAIGMALYFLR